MPYISTKVTTKITHEQELALREKYAKSITLLPGKSNAHLMLSFEENCRLHFAGENNFPIAFIEVSLLGKSTKEGYAALTKQICADICEVFNSDDFVTYVKYCETETWGMNGTNF